MKLCYLPELHLEAHHRDTSYSRYHDQNLIHGLISQGMIEENEEEDHYQWKTSSLLESRTRNYAPPSRLQRSCGFVGERRECVECRSGGSG